jgi:hypothetical protein
MTTAEAFKRMREIGLNIWTTRSGEKISFADMDCGHLRNVAKMMGRKRQKAIAEADACAGYSGGDMAEYYADQAMAQAFQEAGRIRNDIMIVSEYVKLREEHGLILRGPK